MTNIKHLNQIKITYVKSLPEYHGGDFIVDFGYIENKHPVNSCKAFTSLYDALKFTTGLQKITGKNISLGDIFS